MASASAVATMTNEWIDQFPGLARLDAEPKSELLMRSKTVDLPRGTLIFGPGKAPENWLLLISGTVRVQEVAESGREIVLYRVNAGESCALTTACLLAYEDYRAEGLAETEVRAIAVPRSAFEDLIARSAEFRRFVFTAYARRITDLFMVIEEVAFRRGDIRLAHKLLEIGQANGVIQMTHQQLATELGTAREVVSRQLHEFVRRGWVETNRGEVRLADPTGLRKFAQSG